MNRLYTFGYGETTKRDFLARIRDLQKSAPLLLVVDIRKQGRTSTNGIWCSQAKIGKTLKRIHVACESAPALANRFGRSVGGLKLYKYQLLTSDLPIQAVSDLIGKLEPIYERCYDVCLLCSEQQPFSRGHPNSHRVPLAEVIADKIDLSIEIVHW